MKNLGKFKTNSIKYIEEISFTQLKIGINNFKNYIIKIDDNFEIKFVIDKTCDHAGGKLVIKDNEAVCPMHDWRLNLETLKYNNSHISKDQIAFQIINNDRLAIENSEEHLENPFLQKCASEKAIFKWLNHACIYVKYKNVSFITDPWLFGPAFMTGWWLEKESSVDSIELLKNADFVYISHNHPDHLHSETLSILEKDKKIIVPNFKSKSAEKYLKSLGFINILPLEFNNIFELENNFHISIFKSGDFRDDSGVYINIGGFQILLTVDSNYLNSFVLPKNLDLLATSFASGASGFPICYENYNIQEISKIINRNKLSTKASVINYIKTTNPKYYLPYAGMFKEYADRDSFILNHNIKNSLDDLRLICEKNEVIFLEPQKEGFYEINGKNIDFVSTPTLYLEKDDTNWYIESYKRDFVYSSIKIIEYFKNSEFFDKQIVQIIPTDDSFESIIDEIIYIDFYNQIFKIISSDDLVSEKSGYKVMKVKIRKEIIACVVENKIPWEDLSIGFQMRVFRSPNQYESTFWYHFTNNYINDREFRYSSFCGACNLINQNPVFNKSNL